MPTHPVIDSAHPSGRYGYAACSWLGYWIDLGDMRSSGANARARRSVVGKQCHRQQHDGQPLDATVKRLGARIDEGSQTLLLVATLPNASGLLAGMSGTARFAELK